MQYLIKSIVNPCGSTSGKYIGKFFWSADPHKAGPTDINTIHRLFSERWGGVHNTKIGSNEPCGCIFEIMECPE